ncbi:MAG: AAA family ATPase, partial [Okeania sp. SIO4D6]|nr:AAA family ATPase [Okeania sp. SIO4D6]
MPKSANHLLIGSTEAYSGKSTITLGIAHKLQKQGISIAYGKPLGNSLNSVSVEIDADVKFITETLKLSENSIRPTLLMLDESTITKRL